MTPASRRGRCRLRLTVIAAFCLVMFSPCYGQGSGSPEQQELLRAQTENYKAQTAKINQEQGWFPKILGLGTLFAAFVALISFLLNYSATSRAQVDTQFYEALKRFGDKDSASLRASAAGTVAEMGKGKTRRRKRTPKPSKHFATALNQLVAGLLLEENSVALTAIADAIEQLIPLDAVRVTAKLHEANLKLQGDLTHFLAKFFATKTDSESHARLLDTNWNEVAAATPYEEEVLHDIARRHSRDFEKLFRLASHEVKTLSDKKKVEYQIAALEQVRLSAERLQTNVRVYSFALKANPFDAFNSALENYPDSLGTTPSPHMNLAGAFLAEADLQKAHLQGVNLEGAQIQRSTLWSANLRKSYLRHSYLQGAGMSNVDLSGADLFQANCGPLEFKDADGKIYHNAPTDFQSTNLEEAKLSAASFRGADFIGTALWHAEVKMDPDFIDASWWLASFTRRGTENDTDYVLLEFLYERYGDSIPQKSGIWNPAVLEFIQKKRITSVASDQVSEGHDAADKMKESGVRKGPSP